MSAAQTSTKSKVSFSPELFAFLADLRANNDREWFAANKQRYEQALLEPALDFVVDFAPRLEKLSPHFLADPRPSGGSLFRIYRDTRFAKDKTPYKTNAGIHFRHERAKEAAAPGFYLHLAPGEVFAGGGMWHPDTATATRIREAQRDPGRRLRDAVHPRWRVAQASAGGLRRRPSLRRRPQAEELLRLDAALRGGGDRPRLSRRVRARVQGRLAADAVSLRLRRRSVLTLSAAAAV